MTSEWLVQHAAWHERLDGNAPNARESPEEEAFPCAPLIGVITHERNDSALFERFVQSVLYRSLYAARCEQCVITRGGGGRLENRQHVTLTRKSCFRPISCFPTCHASRWRRLTLAPRSSFACLPLEVAVFDRCGARSRHNNQVILFQTPATCGSGGTYSRARDFN